MVNYEYEIIQKIIGGEKSAFRSIMDKYGNLVYNLAYTHVNNVEDARDLTQEIFLKVYKNLKKYKPEYKFFSWLYKISLNTVNSFLKKRKRKPDLLPLDESRDFADVKEAGLPRSEELHNIIGQFKKDMREVFVLFYYEDLDIQTVADITGKSPSNVKVMLHRGRNEIRALLGKESE